MRKNSLLNKTLSLAVAGAMAAGCMLPACAEAAVTKDETVYVVLNSDGSIKSQTVSDHLHSDNGVAAVQDVSTLQNIQNTQGTAAFTQQGDTLLWQSEDTDIYYKGETGETPPISASISYTLDGSRIAAGQLEGKSGHLVISIALANNTMAQAEINGAQRSVCTPFATVVGTMLDESHFANVKAEHGMVQSDGGSSIVGFVALPGVKACLNDLMPDELNKLTDYMLDTLTIEADVTDCTVPALMIACAADASLLDGEDGEGILGDLDKLDGLQDDLDKLDDAMSQLLDGAKQLNDGAQDLNSGAVQLADGTSTLLGGTADLKEGTSTLTDGAVRAHDGASELAQGAAQLDGGATQLASGAEELKGGAATLAQGAANADSGAQQVASGAASLKSGIDEANTGAQSLNSGAAALDAGLQTLNSGLATLSGKSAELNAGAQALADGILATANTQLQAIDPSLTLTWDNYAQVLGSLSGVTDDMRAQAKAQLAAQSGLDGAQLDALILLANQSLASTEPTTEEITAAAAAAGETLQAAAQAQPEIAAAQQALAEGGSPLAVPAVKAVLDAMIAAQQPATTELEQEQTDTFEAAPETAPEAAPETAPATPEQAKEICEETVYDDAGEEYAGRAKGRPENTAAITPEMEAAAYSQIAAAITQGDDATKALLITMACQAVASGSEGDVSTAIVQAADKAAAAATASAAITAAADGSAAAEIEAFLTRAVIASNGTQLQQAAALVNTLGQVQAFVSGLTAYTAGVDSAALGAATACSGSAELAKGAATLAAGTQQLAEGAATLAEGAATLAGGTKQLNSGAATLAEGSGTLAEGAATLAGGSKELNSGAAQLDSGTADLADGAKQLDDGAADLNEGAATLNDGAAKLANGTSDLLDGTGELLDGVNRLDDEGISKLTGAIDLDSLETLKDVASEMKDRQSAYTSYTGAPKNGSCSVKFVMKTAETPKADTTAEAQPTEAAQPATQAKPSLWQRILALFGIGK